MADNIFRRDSLVAEAFYLFNLSGAQTCRISKNFIDSRFTFLICHTRFSPVRLPDDTPSKLSQLRFGGRYA
jgi:hypothetical protein